MLLGYSSEHDATFRPSKCTFKINQWLIKYIFFILKTNAPFPVLVASLTKKNFSLGIIYRLVFKRGKFQSHSCGNIPDMIEIGHKHNVVERRSDGYLMQFKRA